jgi:hypothetical protein
MADGCTNSSVQYVLHAYKCLLADICELSNTPLGAPDDITYEWVLKEAPKLDKQLLCYIEGSGTLPEFPEWLQPLWSQFASTLDANFLRWIRQLLLFCYKIEIEPTHEQLQTAQEAFEGTDRDLAAWDTRNSTQCDQVIQTTARQIIGRIICAINWKEVLPSHGPGAVYPPAKPSAKSAFYTVYRAIDPMYPYCEYFCGLPNYWDSIAVLGDKYIGESSEIVARLVAVPKDSRGPRLICVHPKEAIWIQQGCRRLLERAITSPKSQAHGRINFSDQKVNGRLALESSRSREFCTLDLKEASDRISCELVRSLFGDYAYSWLSCSRATSVRLLDDRVMPLRKWAPMGNALCFPVQSLLFYSIVRSGIRCHYGENCNEVYVFGDDIIFPVKYYDGALNALIRSGLVPNVTKTFRHGFFRESCGVDAYCGKDVTPHRLKKIDVDSVSGAMSVCTLAKALRVDGYRLTSDYLYRSVSKCHGRLPLSNNHNTQGLHRYEDVGLDVLLKYEPTVRFNRKIHRWETKVLLAGGLQEKVHIGDWYHLQDSLLRLARLGPTDVTDRGLEYAVPHRMRLQRGWTEAYYASNPPDPVSLRHPKDAWWDQEGRSLL